MAWTLYPRLLAEALQIPDGQMVLCGMALGYADRELKVYFMAIDGCKFRRMVVPGDVLEMKLTTLRGRPGGKVWRFSGVATVEGEMAAEAEFTAMMDMPAE